MKHDQIAIEADGTVEFGGMYGIVYNPNTSKVASTNGAGGSPLWANKTDDEIVADIKNQYLKVISDTKGVHTPNTIALSPEKLAFLKTTKYGVDTNTTIAMFIETALNVSFVSHARLSGMKKNPATLAGGTFDVMIVYWRDPMNINYKMPMPYRTYPAVNEGRSMRIETASTCAGVEIVFPLSVVCFYGF
jgi:hypothetical protein